MMGRIKKFVSSAVFPLLVILIISAVFRLYRLRTIPDWFQDEGEFIRLADYLSRGNFDFLGVRNSLLLIGRPPLFLWVLAGLFKLFGTDIFVLRSLTVICSFFTIGVCYFLTHQAIGKTTAFYAAFLLAIFPEYIFYNRIGVSYNWTSLWMLIFVFGLWKYVSVNNLKWLLVTCIAAGIAIASDYIGIVCVLVLFLFILFSHPSQLWKMLIIPIPWLISMLPIFIVAPVDAWHDLEFSLFWGLGGEGNILLTLATMTAKYSETFRRQPLIILGLIGIFTLTNNRLRSLLLILLGGITLLLLPSRVFLAHYLLPVWPLIMIGLGSFLEKSISFIYSLVRSSISNLLKKMQRLDINEKFRNSLTQISSTLVVFFIVFLPITWMIILSFGNFILSPVSTSLGLVENPFSAGFISADQAEAIANEISPTLNQDDFVIAPSVISWMLPSNAADARTVVVYEYGGATLGMGNFDKDRFTVNSSSSNAKYAVVDDIWREWMVNMAPEISMLMDEVQTWPLVMERGSLQLFCNPKYCQ
jgi:4-amino-4-deoxy-L-arabinose transferase-like glycosyltransferase